MTKNNTTIIIGAGPAGITAGLELVRAGKENIIILEALTEVGGISRTINHNGYRMDIGGHRFFSKNDWVMDWWKEMMPISEATTNVEKSAPKSLLIRKRISRIYFLRKFFDYPISLNTKTIKNLGGLRILKIGLSYCRARISPIRNEKNLEDFFENRFGRALYKTFFKDYTEKVWGVSCKQISSEWGAQRIKGLSITSAITHAIKKITHRRSSNIAQKDTETSLIETFLYPTYGPGQMWEIAAQEFIAKGGQIHFGKSVSSITLADSKVIEVKTISSASGAEESWECAQCISSMPVQNLITAMGSSPPGEVKRVAQGLVYRDFITIGVLLKKLRPQASASGSNNLLPDNWVYIQEPDVRIGRLQIFNNWSPALVKDPSKVWLGLEYFCQENDDLWSMNDKEFASFAIAELEKIGIASPCDVEDVHIERIPKAYPAYFGTYSQFDTIRSWIDKIENLYLVGRNGMHRYNNQDHSMLTGKHAANAIISGKNHQIAKNEIWATNTEQEYHERK